MFRLVRDIATGIGKGFGYVNFASKDSVETALRLDGNMVNLILNCKKIIINLSKTKNFQIIIFSTQGNGEIKGV